MTLNLVNVVMLTGLNISHPVVPSRRSEQITHKLDAKDVGGWTKYIANHMKNGLVGDREHATFLNMWLEKFVLCGSTLGPTSNQQSLEKNLASGNGMPLGKLLLGATYSLMDRVSRKLSPKEPIGNIGGPSCFA